MSTTPAVGAELLRYERQGSIALLTLNRPDKLNAINVAMLAALERALDQAEADAAVRAIVVNGAGRAFSAGFDLDMELAGGTTPDAAAVRHALENDFRVIMRFWDSPKVTLAAVHGYCLGGALELALACDLTFASEECRFGAPEVRFGSGIVALLLPWIAGPRRAKQWLLSGDDRVSSAEALAAGVVNRVVPTGRVLEETLAQAQRIASNDLQAVTLTKQAINRSLDAAGLRAALRQALDINITLETSESAEAREFNAILARDGARAAIAWRSARAGAPGKEQS